MQLHKYHARFAGCLMAAALVTLFPACKPLAHSKATPVADAHLQSFVADKEQQSRELFRADGSEMPALMKDYFQSVARSDWRSASNLFEKMSARRAPADGGTPDRPYQIAAWQPVAETSVAAELLMVGDGKFARAFGQGIIDSLPAGCVYFGGTDPGRFLVTALMTSHRRVDPFFVVTQYQLADGTYLAYLRSMFEGKHNTPSTD